MTSNNTDTLDYPRLPPYEDIDAWVWYYRKYWGINTVPAPSVDKGKKRKDRQFSWMLWEEFQAEPISEEQQKEWIAKGEYSKRQGIGLIADKVWFGPNAGKHLCEIDADNKLGIQVVCQLFGVETLQDCCKLGMVVEQHYEDEIHKAHFYLYTDQPMLPLAGIKTRIRGKSSEELKALVEGNLLPANEVKTEGGLTFGAPGLHAGGKRYRHIAGSPPVPTLCLTAEQVVEKNEKLKSILAEMLRPYSAFLVSTSNGNGNANESGKSSRTLRAEELRKPDYKVYAGNDRHTDCLVIGDSALTHFWYLDKEKQEEAALQDLLMWNREHCIPPLDEDEVIDLFVSRCVPYIKKLQLKEEKARAERTRTVNVDGNNNSDHTQENQQQKEEEQTEEEQSESEQEEKEEADVGEKKDEKKEEEKEEDKASTDEENSSTATYTPDKTDEGVVVVTYQKRSIRVNLRDASWLRKFREKAAVVIDNRVITKSCIKALSEYITEKLGEGHDKFPNKKQASATEGGNTTSDYYKRNKGARGGTIKDELKDNADNLETLFKELLGKSPSEIVSEATGLSTKIRNELLNAKALYKNNARERGDKVFDSFEEWQQATQRRLELYRDIANYTFPGSWPGIEFVLSVHDILNIADNTLPFAGIMLGEPGGNKTLSINQLKDTVNTFYLDSHTARSWVSHYSASKDEDPEEMEKRDLLPKIENNFYGTSELAPLFGQNDDSLIEELGVITRLMDGQGYTSASGVAGVRGYDRALMFVWVGAVVDIPYRIHYKLAHLGPKLYFFRMPKINLTHEQKRQLLKYNDHSQRDRLLKAAMYNYLLCYELCPIATVDDAHGRLLKIEWNSSKDDSSVIDAIIELAELLRCLRGAVTTRETDKYQQGVNFQHYSPIQEATVRTRQQLHNLARGHALSCGRNYVTREDLPVVVKTVLSSAADTERVKALDILLQIGKRKWINQATLAKKMNVSPHPAGRVMTEFEALGMVDLRGIDLENPSSNRPEIRLKKEFDWFYSKEFRDLRENYNPGDDVIKQKRGRKPRSNTENSELNVSEKSVDGAHSDEIRAKGAQNEEIAKELSEYNPDPLVCKIFYDKQIQTRIHAQAQEQVATTITMPIAESKSESYVSSETPTTSTIPMGAPIGIAPAATEAPTTTSTTTGGKSIILTVPGSMRVAPLREQVEVQEQDKEKNTKGGSELYSLLSSKPVFHEGKINQQLAELAIFSPKIDYQKLHPVCRNLVVFDFEYTQDARHNVYLWSYCDTKGEKGVWNVRDFPTAKDFANAVNKKIESYDYSCAYWSRGRMRNKGEDNDDSDVGEENGNENVNDVSDLMAWYNFCERVGADYNIVHPKSDYDSWPTIKSKANPKHRHLDVHSMHEQTFVKNTIFKGAIRSMSLEDVYLAVFPKNKIAKLPGVDGANVHTFPDEIQRAYCLRDSIMVLELITKANGQLLGIMDTISKYISKDIEYVCHAENMAYLVEPVLTHMKYPVQRPDPKKPWNIQHWWEKKYEGGLVQKPLRGRHDNVKGADCVGMYPQIVITFNLSSETVQCSCCKNNPEARKRALTGDPEIDKKGYWICMKNDPGLFPQFMEGLKKKRQEFKDLRDAAVKEPDIYEQYDIAQTGIKVYMNSSYGSFGFKKFEYADKRVASLITAFGRKFAVGAKELAESDKYGFVCVYGDTDSLLLKNKPDDPKYPQDTFEERFSNYLKECYELFKLPIDNDKNYIEFTPVEKKQYIGIDAKTKTAVVRGLEGFKRDQCKFISEQFFKFVANYEQGLDPIADVKASLAKLDSGKLGPEDLVIKKKLGRSPSKYIQQNSIQAKIGRKQRKKKGELIEYYKTGIDGDAASIHFKDVGLNAYKETHLTAIGKPLYAMGYDVDSIYGKEFGASKELERRRERNDLKHNEKKR